MSLIISMSEQPTNSYSELGRSLFERILAYVTK